MFSRPLAPTSSTSSVPCTISSSSFSSLLPPCRAAPLQAASLPDRWYAGAEIRISEGGSWLAALKLMRGWLLASLAGVLGAPPLLSVSPPHDEDGGGAWHGWPSAFSLAASRAPAHMRPQNEENPTRRRGFRVAQIHGASPRRSPATSEAGWVGGGLARSASQMMGSRAVWAFSRNGPDHPSAQRGTRGPSLSVHLTQSHPHQTRRLPHRTRNRHRPSTSAGADGLLRPRRLRRQASRVSSRRRRRGNPAASPPPAVPGRPRCPGRPAPLGTRPRRVGGVRRPGPGDLLPRYFAGVFERLELLPLLALDSCVDPGW